MSQSWADSIAEVKDALGDPDGITIVDYATMPDNAGPVVLIGGTDGASMDSTERYPSVVLQQRADSGKDALAQFWAAADTIYALLKAAAYAVVFQSRLDRSTSPWLHVGIFTVDVPREDLGG